MSEVYEEGKERPFTPIDAKRVMAVVALGAVVGLVVWALTLVIDRYVLSPVLCQGSEALRCAGSAQYAEAAASIIGTGIGLFFLVRLQVFRPLLVALASTVTLWGIVAKAELLPWYGVGLSVIAMYLFAYLLFSWIARLRAFWVVILVMVMTIAAVRLVLNY